MLEGVKLSRAIARTPCFAPFLAGELLPGDAVDDNALATFIPSSVAVYGHPTSTVPMGGPGDPGAVVDSAGAVKGRSGLRVIDASIIPEIPSAPTNLTVIMLAERIFCPLGSAFRPDKPVLTAPAVVATANRLGATTAQVALAWLG